MKKILMISHDASRTGAPMVLLYFLKWVKHNKLDVQVDVVALEGGALENDFKGFCDNYYVYNELVSTIKFRLLKRVFYKIGILNRNRYIEKVALRLVQNNYNLVYANTIIGLPLAHHLVSRDTSIKLIAHIHELNGVIRMLLPNFRDYLDSVNHFIVPAEIVKSNLVQNWNVSEKRIEVIYECSVIGPLVEKVKTGSCFTIGASGTVDWRKGYDIFIQVARYICKNYPEIAFKFIWVGKISQREEILIEEDLSKLGLNDKVIFTGEVKEPCLYYKEFDVFLMTSREDPFPLVCIEVGMLGKPIISFDKAVGTNEILNNGGGGFVVPYLDIEGVSSKILEYYYNPLILQEHGERNKIAFSEFSPEKICPLLYEQIFSLLN